MKRSQSSNSRQDIAHLLFTQPLRNQPPPPLRFDQTTSKITLLSGLTPLKPDLPHPGGKPRKIRFYRPPATTTIPVSLEANAARAKKLTAVVPVLDEHSTT